MAFGSVRRTHFNEALKALRWAESAIKSLEIETSLEPEPLVPLPGTCNNIFHKITTVHEFLVKADTDLARSGAINKMLPEEREEYLKIKSLIGFLHRRYTNIRYVFENSCLLHTPRS